MSAIATTNTDRFAGSSFVGSSKNSAVAHEKERRAGDDGKPVVLLVDDVPENLLALEAMLRRDDVKILTAGSGSETLELLLEWKIALAIIDVQMPEMDGFELAALMRGVERTRRVPIIFVTAGVRDRARLFKGYETGAVDFLFKPIEPAVLRSKVDVFVTLERQVQELTRSEQRFRSLVQATSQTVWRCTPDGRMVEDSPSRREFTGQNFEEARDHGWIKAVHPDDRVLARTVWNQAVSTRMPFEVEYRLRRPDGRYTWTLARGVPVIDDRGEVIEWVRTNTDVHARKEAERREALLLQRLTASEAKFRRMYEAGIVGVFFAESEGKIVDANDAFLRLVGHDRKAVDGGRLNWRELVSDSGETDPIAILGQVGPTMPLEMECVHQDGQRVPVLCGGAALPALRLGVGFVLDISQQKQAERLREIFVGILGHDLRNPLGAIIAATNQVLSRSNDEVSRTLLKRVVASGTRMTRLIEQVLDLTRLRVGGGIALSLATTDLRAIVAQATAEVAEDRFIVAIVGSTIGTWDADRLLQALSNLAGNAVQHGREDAPVKITVDGTATDMVRVEIHNEGEAIPRELQAVLFEPFRGSPGKTRTTKGLGLGLFIARQIVLAHLGTIEFCSSDAEGTSFVVQLPRHPMLPAG